MKERIIGLDAIRERLGIDKSQEVLDKNVELELK